MDAYLHFYISESGLLTTNNVGPAGLKFTGKTLKPGETYTTTDFHGRPVYAQTITSEGWFKLASVVPGALVQTCVMKPSSDGFQSGVSLSCEGHDPVTINVKDDLASGILRVKTGVIAETFRYDRDTGLLQSPKTAPVLPDSVLVPVSKAAFPLPAAAGSAPDPIDTN